jgi:hypothetical protein
MVWASQSSRHKAPETSPSCHGQRWGCGWPHLPLLYTQVTEMVRSRSQRYIVVCYWNWRRRRSRVWLDSKHVAAGTRSRKQKDNHLPSTERCFFLRSGALQ